MKNILICVLALSGCAKIPAVSSNYYLTKSSLQVGVTRALTCDSKGLLSITNAVSPVVTNFADVGAEKSFDLQELRGPFSDPNVKVDFYPDGRLQGINSIQTGTAKQVIESVLTVVGAVSTKAAPAAAQPEVDPCKHVKEYKNKQSGVLILQYSRELNVPGTGTQQFEPLGVSEFHHEQLKKTIGNLHAHINSSSLTKLAHPVSYDPAEQPQVLIARQLTKVSFGIHTDIDRKSIWNGSVLMALPGNEYGIPIPSKAAFGKQEFVVTFLDSGALGSLKYASTSGAADAGTVAGAVIDELQGPTAADQAKALQAEADLIKQRQRLADCQANPATCQ